MVCVTWTMQPWHRSTMSISMVINRELQPFPPASPAGGHAAHGNQAHAGAQQIGDLAGKVRLADARWPQQEHGGHLQAVVTVLAQGHVPPDVVQRIGEVGQLRIQRRHVGDARGHAFLRVPLAGGLLAELWDD